MASIANSINISKKLLLVVASAVIVLLGSCIKEPHASFVYSPSDPIIGEPIKFTNTSADGDHYEWHFDDREFSTMTNTEHIYVEAGTYRVMLTAYSEGDKKANDYVKDVKVGTKIDLIYLNNVNWLWESTYIIENGKVSEEKTNHNICENDDLYNFATGGILYEYTSNRKCNSNDPYFYKGNWIYNTSDGSLIMILPNLKDTAKYDQQAYRIDKLTENNMLMSIASNGVKFIFNMVRVP